MKDLAFFQHRDNAFDPAPAGFWLFRIGDSKINCVRLGPIQGLVEGLGLFIAVERF